MEAKEALKIIALCNLILVWKYFGTVIFQGVRRTRAPEDGFQPSVIKQEKEMTQPLNDSSNKFEFSEEKRWQRIVMNDLENVLMGVIMIWISFFISNHHLVTAICGVVFTTSRCLHTLCYIFKLMPWRALCWLFGVLSTLALSINIVYGAFKANNDIL